MSPLNLPPSAAGFYPSNIVSALEFGVVGDNSTLNTLALQKAIDTAASLVAGAIVVLPAGVFRTGTVYLRSNTYLYFMRGAFLQGTADPTDYAVDWDQWDVVHTSNATNCGLLGDELADETSGGVVGPMWQMVAGYDAAQDQLQPVMWHGVHGCRGECRPRGVAFVDCTNVTVARVSIRDSAGTRVLVVFDHRSKRIWLCVIASARSSGTRIHHFALFLILYTPPSDWSSLYRRCDNVRIANLQIRGSALWANNDGIDLESGSNYTLDALDIDVGDDGVVFAAGNTNDLNHAWPEAAGAYTPLRRVRVSNVRVRSRSSALKFEAIFQAAHGRVDDVDIRDVDVLQGTNRGLGFQQRTGGDATAALWSNVRVTNVRVHTSFGRGTNWWGAGEPLWISSVPESGTSTPLGGIRNVTIANFTARGANAALISAPSGDAARGLLAAIRIVDSSFTVESATAYVSDSSLVRAIHDYRPIDDASRAQWVQAPVVVVALEGTLDADAVRFERVRFAFDASATQGHAPPYWTTVAGGGGGGGGDATCVNATADARVALVDCACTPPPSAAPVW